MLPFGDSNNRLPDPPTVTFVFEVEGVPAVAPQLEPDGRPVALIVTADSDDA